jgi:hypothetical protein
MKKNLSELFKRLREQKEAKPNDPAYDDSWDEFWQAVENKDEKTAKDVFKSLVQIVNNDE